VILASQTMPKWIKRFRLTSQQLSVFPYFQPDVRRWTRSVRFNSGELLLGPEVKFVLSRSCNDSMKIENKIELLNFPKRALNFEFTSLVKP